MERTPAFSPLVTRRFPFLFAIGVSLGLVFGCDRSSPAPVSSAPPPNEAPRPSSSPRPSPESEPPTAAPDPPKKVDVQDRAMGTSLHFIAYTNQRNDEAATRSAIQRAIAEMRRLERLMSEWRDDSEVGQINLNAGKWVTVSPETFEVLSKSVEAGKLSKGTFDITFQVMSGLWKFGSAQEPNPRVPANEEIARLRRLIDYRRVELDATKRSARIGSDQKIGLGGIAKGYIVDRAAQVLREAGLDSFLVQAGGDLYGAGRKPDGSPWVSGIQDPRGPEGKYFALIELTDHAFSTAGDYARSYIVDGKRYHHIIDPRTGYPATASRSVTIWAPDATVADMVDDAVFILGPKEGLELVESLDGVGAVIVDHENRVIVSRRLEGKLKLLAQPTPGL